MQRQTVWECVVHKPGSLYPNGHVCHGSGAILFGHLFVVHHLERGVQRWKVLLPWSVNLDTLEGYLHETAEEDLC